VTLLTASEAVCGAHATCSLHGSDCQSLHCSLWILAAEQLAAVYTDVIALHVINKQTKRRLDISLVV
jgi:hypothetical protein